MKNLDVYRMSFRSFDSERPTGAKGLDRTMRMISSQSSARQASGERGILGDGLDASSALR